MQVVLLVFLAQRGVAFLSFKMVDFLFFWISARMG